MIRPHPHGRLAWFMGVIFFCLPARGVAQAQPTKKAVVVTPTDPVVERAFGAAQVAYQSGQYARVIQLLRPLIVPKTRINTKSRLLAAHKMLAISYVFLKNISAAEASFGAILAEDPSYHLDPAVDPAAAVRIFRSYRRRNEAMLHKIEEAQAQARRNEREAQKRREAELRQLRDLAKTGTTVIERHVVSHPYWLNFIPFGVGQFQNGHRTKGWILLSAEIALGATSLATALAYRFAFPDLRASSDGDTAAASALAVTQVVAGALFWAVAIYGVADAIIYYRPEVVTETHRKQKVSVILTPTLTRSSAGLGFSVTF